MIPLFAEKALKHLERVEADEVEAYTSTLVIAQVIAHLARRRRGQAITMFLEYIDSAQIVVASTEWSDYLEALQLARENNLSIQQLWDDLVIAAQMKRLGINTIISNDKDFDKIPGVDRVF